MHGLDNLSFPPENSYPDTCQEKYSMNHFPGDFIEKEKLQDEYGSYPFGYDSNGMYNDGYNNSPYRISVNKCGSNTKDVSSSRGSVYVPKHPKVFARRVPGRKNEHNHSYIPTHHSYDPNSNGIGSNNKNLVRRRSYMNKQDSHNRNMNESTKVSPFRPNKGHSNQVRKMYASTGDINTSSLLDVPLCVQEAGNNMPPHYNRFMPMHSLNQDEYYLNHYLNHGPESSLKPSPEKLIKVVQILFKCMFKTVRLVIEKIRKELDTREYVNPDYRIPSLPNLDVACDVCETTEEVRMRRRENKAGDGFRYFEEPDTTPKFIKKLWGTLNDWIDLNEKGPITFEKRMEKRNDTEVVYKVEEFPKDENGKVELPEFEKTPKKN